MSETSDTPVYDKFRRRCLDAVEGMKFFGRSVQDMEAEELLVVVGHLVGENERLMNDAKGRRLVRGRWYPPATQEPPPPPPAPPGPLWRYK